MKKIYLFYLYDSTDKMNTDTYPAIDDDNIKNGKENSYSLYAWTPNKLCRKQFKSLRDMLKFKEIIHEIAEEDFDKFADDNSDTFLEYRLLTTKRWDKNRIMKKHSIRVLSTKRELEIMIYDYQIFLRKQLECIAELGIYLSSECFSKEFSELLEHFYFNDLISFVYPIDEYSETFDKTLIDTLAMYSSLYLNTYRKDVENL